MADAKQQVIALQKADPKNKLCVDCGSPNPQWASVTFAVYFCLQCAGVHRSFGVHISFVRSVTMDSWQQEQARRMELGGNQAFVTFMEAYTPAEDGGYRANMPLADKYTCWAARQYREKLDCMLVEGKEWTQSPPPPRAATPDVAGGQPSTGLRKSRAAARSSTLRSGSASPAPSQGSFGTPNPDEAAERKANNESFFAGLGVANASRPENLPPSQGGRYVGFGSTPAPSPPTNSHPSFGLSSASAPTLTEFQENPVAALGKGWSIFSAAVMGASKTVNESIIQPGMEKVTDPNLVQSVKGYAAEASKQAATLGKNANDWSKNRWGVDVANQVGGMFDTVKTATGVGQRPPAGYGYVDQHDDETSALYADAGDDDFFNQHTGSHASASTTTATTSAPASSAAPAASAPKKKNDDWEDW